MVSMRFNAHPEDDTTTNIATEVGFPRQPICNPVVDSQRRMFSVRSIYAIVLVSGLLVISASSTGQVALGRPPLATLGGDPFDTLNLGNLNVHFEVPVFSKAGRGTPFSYSLGYDSSVWSPATSNGVTSWVRLSNWGWYANSPSLGGSITTKPVTNWPCIDGPGPPPVIQYVNATRITSYVDPFGTPHKVNVMEDPCSTGGRFSGTTLDGSGWTVSYNGLTGQITANSRGGVIVVPNVGWVGSYTDANGNEITANSSGQTFDTLSSTTPVLTVAGAGTPSSPTTITYTAPSGSSAKYTVNYTQYTVRTNFGVSDINEYGPLSNALVSSIQLSDGSVYTFAYEPTPGSCTPLSGTFSGYCITGRIVAVTLPAGGTISYSYIDGSNGIESDGSATGLTRSLSPGGL